MTDGTTRGTVTARPRNSRPPEARAAFGVGVIVLAPQGQVLLGRHRTGTWELPGGKIDPGESVRAAAARELHEETGLHAEPHAVRVFAMLHDDVQGVHRITMAAVVTACTGTPYAAEPDIVSDWQWHDPTGLPDPLFTPSAQILAAWRPDLDIEVSPPHFFGIAAPVSHHDRRESPDADGSRRI
ncbi:nucleotide triphosphate diphosphatase NUDT15 [Streptomyces decoyicus]|uniref:nucleotide triphosphate diphosphatase NUDT15 n=1 Tax=Streptomyces decoyicus TaxID=249567 RepID=UPI0033A0F095